MLYRGGPAQVRKRLDDNEKRKTLGGSHNILEFERKGSKGVNGSSLYTIKANTTTHNTIRTPNNI